MLGRHVYRVVPLAGGGWSVEKEGEAAPRGRWPSREAATGKARELAAADEPSRLVVEEPAGTIVDERLFGADTALEVERLGEDAPPPKGEPPRRR